MKFDRYILITCMLALLPSLSPAQNVEELKAELPNAIDAFDSMNLYAQIADYYFYNDIDSVPRYVSLTGAYAKKINSVNGIVTYYVLQGKLADSEQRQQEAIDMFWQALRLSDSVDYLRGQDLALTELGFQYRRKGRYDSSNLMYERLLRLNQDSFSEAVALNGMALNYSSVGAMTEAAEAYFKVLQLLDTADHDSRGVIYQNLGILYKDQQNEAEALRYYNLSLEEANKAGLLSRIGEKQRQLAGLFIETAAFDSASHYLALALAASRQAGDGYTETSALIDQLSLLLARQQWTTARSLQLQLADRLQGKANPYQQVSYYRLLARYYAQKPQPEPAKALASLDTALLVSGGSRVKDLYPKILLQQSELLARAAPARALQLYKRYTSIQDSIASANNRNYTAMLQIRYETEKKERAIENLSQQTQIQQLQINQRNTQLLIAGLVLLLLAVGGGLMYRHRRQQHQQAMNNLQQRLLQVQLNPHFIFNSLAAIQYYMLQKGVAAAGEYLGIFSKLMRQILENSRQEYITLQEETDMLQNYLSLQSMRFDYRFTYELELDDAIDPDYMGVPPMFTQPFIENALEHGLFRKEGTNHISIRYQLQAADRLSISIEDNGTGTAQGDNARSHQSLATSITRERLVAYSQQRKGVFTLQTGNIQQEGSEVAGFMVNLELPCKLILS